MSRHPYPVRVSADGVAAIRNPYATGSEDAPWLITDNAPGTDADVEGWMPYAPFPELDTQGGPADQIARVLDGAVESRNIDDAETSRALRDAIMHTLRTKQMLIEDPAVSVFADTLNEWVAHWPPRKGNDVTLEPIYAALDELTPERLEQIAVAASALSQRCWEVRGPKLVEESRKEQGITWASVTVTSDGKLLPGSVVTVDEASAPIPERTATGGILAANRLSAALRTLGYQAVNLRDTVLDGERLSFLVRKVPAGE